MQPISLATTFLTLLATTLASGLPLSNNNPSDLTARTATTKTTITITASQLLAIAPSASSCASASYPDECRTASQAAPHISAAFSKYAIMHPGTQAAVLATMLYESSAFAYNTHHYPSVVPGQGTRNMQAYKYNLLYAEHVAGADAVAAAGGEDGVLSLVLGDEASFGSEAWFLATQCWGWRGVLAEGTVDGYRRYTQDCVDADWDGEREAYYTKALEVLGG